MAKTANLAKAKETKNDEFYTQWADIQKEVNAYLEFDPDTFRGKSVLLPCDDPEWSNFTKFFAQNFEAFGLKRLVSTSYAFASKRAGTPQRNRLGYWQPTLFEKDSPRFDAAKSESRGKIFVLDRDANGNGRIDIEDLQWSYLDGDGDFRSDEVRRLRDEADVIVTNPPFSLFREFMAWIAEGRKYEVRLRHASTDPDYSGYPDPDYDYRLVMTPLETPPRVILDDPDGLFGTNKSDQASTFTTSPKVAHLYVLKPTVVISKSGQPSWDEMPESEVVLSDEDLRIRITVEPNVPSLDVMKEALGDKYTIFTDTKLDGAAVDFVADDQFVQNASSSEIRITKTRNQLKALGLLPVNEEDNVAEMAWMDTADLFSPNSVQNLEDSNAFSELGHIFRGKATDDPAESLGSDPPNSQCSASFFKAAGCEIIVVEYADVQSHRRQIMNQADTLYFSGHGGHHDGKVNGGGSNERFGPQEITAYWGEDLDCVIIAGCSVLDVNDFNGNFGGAEHYVSPGKSWETTGPLLLLGYNYIAPGDKGGAPKRIVQSWLANRLALGDAEAWMNANKDNHAWNACVIEKNSKYIYFKRILRVFHTKQTVLKENWQ